MSNRQTIAATITGDAHGRNYADEYLRYKNINTYFFKDNSSGEKYWWETNKEFEELTPPYPKPLTISFLPTEVTSHYGRKITHVKIL